MRRFPLGHIVMTQGANEVIEAAGTDGRLLALGFLFRHQNGDWGEVSDDDKESNDEAVENGDRLLSAYILHRVKLWIITDADRSVTTILLPDEY